MQANKNYKKWSGKEIYLWMKESLKIDVEEGDVTGTFKSGELLELIDDDQAQYVLNIDD